MELKDKIVIVTGASFGIGLEIAKRLSKEGAKVVMAARSKDRLEEVAKGLQDAYPIPTDMKDEKQIDELFDKTMKTFGRIDILINNAGQGLYSPLEKVDMTQYKGIMQLNVFSVVHAMQKVIPIMRGQGGGMILNVSSRVSKNYYPMLSAYASTKYALNAISLTARQELVRDNIRVIVFHPKMTSTDFAKNSLGILGGQFPNRNNPEMQIDTPEMVAKKIIEQLKTEEAETGM